MLFLIAVFFLATVASGTAAVVAISTKSKNGSAAAQLASSNLKELDSDKMSQLYTLYKNYYRKTNFAVKKNLEEIFVTASALIEKVSKVGSEPQKDQITYELNYLFGKLIEVLRPEYYYEIKTKPEYWSNSEQLAKEVESAVIAVNNELHKNMRLLNSSQELDFKVNLKILNNKGEDNAIQDIYNITKNEEK